MDKINLSGLTPLKKTKSEKQTFANEMIKAAQRGGHRKLKFTSKLFDISAIEKQAKELGVFVETLNQASKLVYDLNKTALRHQTGLYYKQGLILSIIQYRKLFKHKYSTFEKFVQAELDFGTQQAYDLMKVAKSISWPDACRIGDRIALLKFVCRSKMTDNLRDLAIERIEELSKQKVPAQKIEKILRKTFDEKEILTDEEIEITIEDNENISLLQEIKNRKLEEIQLKTLEGMDINSISDFIDSGKSYISIKIHDLLYIHVLFLIESDTIRINARFSVKG